MKIKEMMKNLNNIKVFVVVISALILCVIWGIADEQRQINSNYQRITNLSDTVQYYRKKRKLKHNSHVDTLFVHHIIVQPDGAGK